MPISAIELASDNPNVAWDNLRFNPVPEPSTLLLFGCGLAGIAVFLFVLLRAASSAASASRPRVPAGTEKGLLDFAVSRE